MSNYKSFDIVVCVLLPFAGTAHRHTLCCIQAIHGLNGWLLTAVCLCYNFIIIIMYLDRDIYSHFAYIPYTILHTIFPTAYIDTLHVVLSASIILLLLYTRIFQIHTNILQDYRVSYFWILTLFEYFIHLWERRLTCATCARESSISLKINAASFIQCPTSMSSSIFLW